MSTFIVSPFNPSQAKDLWWLFDRSVFKLNIFPFAKSMKYNSVIFFAGSRVRRVGVPSSGFSCKRGAAFYFILVKWVRVPFVNRGV